MVVSHQGDTESILRCEKIFCQNPLLSTVIVYFLMLRDYRIDYNGKSILTEYREVHISIISVKSFYWYFSVITFIL